MSGILYKNFLAYKLDLIALGAMDAICVVTILLATASAPAHSLEGMLTGVCPMIYFSMFFMVSIFDHQLFAADEKRTIGSFIISTPLGAKGHVEGKYYTLLIVNIATLVICFLTDTIICLIVDSTIYSMGAVLMIIFCINILYTAFGNPFYLRFGMQLGNSVKFGSIGVLFLIVLI
ncbi:MAG: ABC-2 transporter permease [Oscillospiraceae bacterium]|nr:ABC-2 transporter permease [Oscillospiraceae bacterium]